MAVHEPSSSATRTRPKTFDMSNSPWGSGAWLARMAAGDRQ
jgi:hypothetical protein